MDSDLRVVSSAVDDLPEWIRNEFLHSSPGDDISNLTFFYHPKLDIVVLNSENRHADLYELLVTTYLPADAEDRRKFKTEAPAKAVGHAIEVLDYIIEKRGKHA